MSDFTFLPQLPQEIAVICVLHAVGCTSENIDMVEIESEKVIPFLLLDSMLQLQSISAIARVCKSWNQLLNEKESPGKIIWKKLNQLCLWNSFEQKEDGVEADSAS